MPLPLLSLAPEHRTRRGTWSYWPLNTAMTCWLHRRPSSAWSRCCIHRTSGAPGSQWGAASPPAGGRPLGSNRRLACWHHRVPANRKSHGVMCGHRVGAPGPRAWSRAARASCPVTGTVAARVSPSSLSGLPSPPLCRCLSPAAVADPAAAAGAAPTAAAAAEGPGASVAAAAAAADTSAAGVAGADGAAVAAAGAADATSADAIATGADAAVVAADAVGAADAASADAVAAGADAAVVVAAAACAAPSCIRNSASSCWASSRSLRMASTWGRRPGPGDSINASSAARTTVCTLCTPASRALSRLSTSAPQSWHARPTSWPTSPQHTPISLTARSGAGGASSAAGTAAAPTSTTGAAPPPIGKAAVSSAAGG